MEISLERIKPYKKGRVVIGVLSPEKKGKKRWYSWRAWLQREIHFDYYTAYFIRYTGEKWNEGFDVIEMRPLNRRFNIIHPIRTYEDELHRAGVMFHALTREEKEKYLKTVKGYHEEYVTNPFGYTKKVARALKHIISVLSTQKCAE